VDSQDEEGDRALKKQRTSPEGSDEEQREVEHDLNAFGEDSAMVVHHCEIRFRAVDTDPNEDGLEDLEEEDIVDSWMVASTSWRSLGA
jgi:hypothetical protein